MATPLRARSAQLPVLCVESKTSCCGDADFEVLERDDKITRPSLPREEKKEDKGAGDCLPSVLFGIARSVFPKDRPFRTTLGLMGDVVTSASGIINLQLPVSNISSASEWSAVNSLFDEFYIHAMRISYEPYNLNGTVGSGAVFQPVSTVNTTAGIANVQSAGLIVVGLQGPPAYYTAAAGMSNAPHHLDAHTGRSWKFAWRNTNRFDPHGDTFSAATSTNGWQGWSYIADSAQYGGTVQARAINDQALNGANSAVHVGGYIVRWDVSFRSRA